MAASPAASPSAISSALTSRAAPRALLGLTLDELTALLESRPRALAALRWVHETRPLPESLPESLPGVSQRSWSRARASLAYSVPQVLTRQASPEGTVKYALESRGARFESVLIPGRGRSTLCLSSQAGCTRRCAFCATSRLAFSRNLEASEIVGQLLVAQGDAPEGAPLRNIVFMGMGEPLDNLDEVLRAVELLMQAPAPQLGANHITVSTSGVLPAMKRFLAECPAALAVSLNATTDDQRERLMPHDKQWPIAELMELLRASSRTSDRVFFIEYVMLEGINDSDEDARRLVALLEGVRARVNLIPYNGFEGSDLAPSPLARVQAFQSLVRAAGLRALVRLPRGDGIDAACGQLALKGHGARRRKAEG